MKSLVKLVVVLAGVFGMAIAHAGDTPDREVALGFSDAFVPSGFGPDSDAYVVASGIFPNGCYHWKQATVKHVSNKVHEVSGTAAVSQGMCLMVLVPFTKEIHLGKLEAGTHSVRMLNGDGTYLEKRMNIEE